ncbi:hypothetical protein HanRHA438_Chr11g0530911 [Helianthus annuus]|nr:hypothetical protein HanRHA438_Chr11g0530911 [Helianthus annuus]
MTFHLIAHESICVTLAMLAIKHNQIFNPSRALVSEVVIDSVDGWDVRDGYNRCRL